MKKVKWTAALCASLALLVASSGYAEEKKFETLSLSYASVSGTRAPLWIAKDLGLFEKYGIDINLVYIASGIISVNALLGGSVQVIAASGSDRKSTRLNSSHIQKSRMPSSA